MKPITAEWVAKAEADSATLERECRARTRPNYDGACFHAQQCAEKYLKARLCEADIRFAKIHDLVSLLESALPLEPLWEAYRQDMAYLSDFSVAYRYPGESATRDDALEALQRCRRFREGARAALGLRLRNASSRRRPRRAGRKAAK
jgi:HEPN domain-containing protein